MAQLNEEIITSLPVPPAGNRIHFYVGAVARGVAAPKGFGVRVTASGAKSFILDFRLAGRQYRYTIGAWPTWKVPQAVREAVLLRKRIDGGSNPLDDRKPATTAEQEPQGPTVAAVLDLFMERHKLRVPKNYQQAFDRLVKPEIGDVLLHDLRRSRIASLLDQIEDKNGPVMANRTLAYLGSALNWYANRDEDFTPPRIKGLKRAVSHGRERVLSDDEIRSIWAKVDDTGSFGQAVKFLALTGQRRGDVFGAVWSEIEGQEWVIPGERYKTGRTQAVPLSAAAQAVLERMDRGSLFVFPNRTGGKLSRGGNSVARFLALTGTEGWTLHDLRRTASSLMSRAGVRPDVAERVLGHVVGGAVERTYDRHSYMIEKRDALEKLAATIDGFCTRHPPKSSRSTSGGSSAAVTEDDEYILPDDDEVDRWEEEWRRDRVRRVIAAGRKIIQGFKELREIRGHEQAWCDLNRFAKYVKPPGKPKGPHRPEMDEEMLAAHQAAPPGKKLKAVYAVGARYGVTPETAQKHLYRLLKRRKESEDFLEKFAENLSTEGRPTS